MTHHKPLRECRFSTDANLDIDKLAIELTALKALASRTPTPVTSVELQRVLEADSICNLFLQSDEEVIVGWCMITVSIFEDRGHLGPIAVHKEGEHTGYGSGLMKYALEYMWHHYPELRRIDLSNRPDHDLEKWYRKFGFIPRTTEEGDPTTVYRLVRPS